MPSAFEEIVKILKFEKQSGCHNTGVSGGLVAYLPHWEPRARSQARRAEQLIVVEEICVKIQVYESLPNYDARAHSIDYMISRIMNPLQVPSEFQGRLEQLRAEFSTSSNVEDKQKTDEPRPRENTPRERRENRRRENPRSEPQQNADQTSSSLKTSSGNQKSADEPSQHQDSQPRPPQRQSNATGQNKNRDQQNNQKGNKPQGARPPQRGGAQLQQSSGKSASESHDQNKAEDHEFSGFDMDQEFMGGPQSPGKLDIPPMPRLAHPPRTRRKPISAQQAVDVLQGINAPIINVKGVGPKTVATLAKLGIHRIKDLLYHMPRRYDDYTQMRYISKIHEDELVTIIGTVIKTNVNHMQGGRRDFSIVIDDSTARMNVVFFGQYYLARQIQIGQQLVIRGITRKFRNTIQLVNPEWDFVEVEDLKNVGLIPVYPLTEGLHGRTLRKLIQRTVEFWAPQIADPIPESTLDRCDLANIDWALKNIHFPESQDHLYHAKRRFIFDQLVTLQLAVLANRRLWQSQTAHSLPVTNEELQTIMRAIFPYELTGAQKKAIEEIRQDAAKTIPMNRLLQGDVGAGKTAVATCALLMAWLSGKQSALMAPTSILAEQHFTNISKAFEKLPYENKPRVALLTGSLSANESQIVYDALAAGEIDILIGTQAVIQEKLVFADLGMAIIDEQHRFGVEQRGALRGKGVNPHLLVMTATPIPRTLALTLHADLDLTVLDEMPPGRMPVRTAVVEPQRRERAYLSIEDQLEKGMQAFIVYPLVEDSDKSDAESAIGAFQGIAERFYPHKVVLLHGRMKPSEKDQIMAAFRNHEYDIMVTTSVAEVGVDIPDASIILIEGANRFGLAQLHQFRGRVGRSGQQAYCYLIPDNHTPESEERLKAMTETNDGFELARRDWQLRGAGDLIGTQQSGHGYLQFMSDIQLDIVELAQREAKTIYVEDPDLTQEKHQVLAQLVRQLRDERTDFS